MKISNTIFYTCNKNINFWSKMLKKEKEIFLERRIIRLYECGYYTIDIICFMFVYTIW